MSGLGLVASAGFVLSLALGLFLAGVFVCLIGWAVDDG